MAGARAVLSRRPRIPIRLKGTDMPNIPGITGLGIDLSFLSGWSFDLGSSFLNGWSFHGPLVSLVSAVLS